MGACGSATCISAKSPSAKPNTFRVKNRPTKADLSSSFDDYEKIDQCNLLAPKVDAHDARIGVYFIKEELLDKVNKRTTSTATKSSRLEKWRYMVTFGLDQEFANKAITKEPRDRKNALEPIEFSSYALVGLKNFYSNDPELFRSRLSKGPPP